jgi:hypothetical protein
MDHIQKIKLLYGLSENEDYGIDENEIITTENRLKIKLPKKLRDYYLKLGNNESINNSFNQLLMPGNIEFTGNGSFLVFYTENQEAVCWAFSKNDIENENPKVYGSYDPDGSTEDWFTDSETTEDFLLSMAYWNGALEGLNFTANYSNDSGIDNNVIERIENSFMEIKGITDQMLRFFTDENIGIVALTFDMENNYNGIYVGSNDEKTYKNILEKIDIKWDYISDDN